MGLKIGLDCDGVIYDFTKAFREAAAKKGFTVGEPDCWNYYRTCGMTDEDFAHIMHCSVDDLALFWRGDVLDNAAYWIAKLQDAGHEIHIVTHRTSGYYYTSEQATKYWFKYKGIEPDSVTFSKDKTVVKADVFLEDNLDNYDALEAAGTEAYLVNRSYNQEIDGRRRVDSFGEFARLWIKEN